MGDEAGQGKDDKGGQGGGGTGGSGTDDQNGGTGSSTERTFTQADLDRIATREKNEGKSAGVREVMQELGIDDVDTAKELIQAAKDAKAAQLSEAQRAEAAAAERERAAEQRERAAKVAAHEAQVDRILLRSGVTVDAKPEDADYDEKLNARLERLRRMVTVEVGADATAIAADVATLKSELPDLFKPAASAGDGGDGGEGGDGRTPAPNSDPGGAPAKPNLKEDAYDAGRARARQKLGLPDDDDKK